MLLPSNLLRASSINLVTWSCVATPMQDFSMRLTPAAAPEHISSFQRTNRFCVSMVPFSQSPKSPSSLWCQLPNLNLQPFLSWQEKWFPTGKPSSLCGGPNQKALSKQITQLLQVLPVKQLFPAVPKWCLCASSGSVAMLPKTNFVTTRMLALSGLTTTPNTTRTPTMKPAKVLMQASGTR